MNSCDHLELIPARSISDGRPGTSALKQPCMLAARSQQSKAQTRDGQKRQLGMWNGFVTETTPLPYD